jgi:integrase
VLEAAKEMDTQTSAFIALALDSGARKAELQGLRWSDVDLATGSLRIERQFLRELHAEEGKPPRFGPTKTGRSRTLDLSAETVAMLREHKREQAEFKLAHLRGVNYFCR